MTTEEQTSAADESDETLRLLCELVAVDTTNPGGDEVGALEVLAARFGARGVATELSAYAPGHANLTATVPFGAGPTVLLNSHVDVVPAGQGWSSDPFVPRVEGGRVYGRGAADAKGSLAAMTVALLSLLDEPGLSGTVVFSAVGDEEVGSTGARALVETVRADACIVGEPTGVRLLTAHKGSVRPVVEVRGLAAHAATPQRGANAVVGAAQVVIALTELAEELGVAPHPLVGSPTLTPVLVEGGQAPNAVPESCRITFDRRLVPGETNEQALAQVTAVLDRFSAEHDGLEASVVDCAPSTGGPSETPADDPVVRAAQRAMRSVGEDPTVGGLVVNCDMTTFRSAGIPTFVLGPGTLEAMHVKDEFVAVEQLDRATRAYRAILRELLRLPAASTDPSDQETPEP